MMTTQETLTIKFNPDDLRLLCADLGYPYHNIANGVTGHASVVLKLVEWAEARGKGQELTNEVMRLRPRVGHLVWKPVVMASTDNTAPLPLTSPQRFFVVATINGVEEVLSFNTEKEAAAAVNIYKRRGTPAEVYSGSKI